MRLIGAAVPSKRTLPVLAAVLALLWSLANPAVWAACLYCEQGDLLREASACCCGVPGVEDEGYDPESSLQPRLPCTGCTVLTVSADWAAGARGIDLTRLAHFAPVWSPDSGTVVLPDITEKSIDGHSDSPSGIEISHRSFPLIC